MSKFGQNWKKLAPKRIFMPPPNTRTKLLQIKTVIANKQKINKQYI